MADVIKQRGGSCSKTKGGGGVQLVVGGMLEVVVAVRVVVIVGRWQRAADVAVVGVVACCWVV